MPIARRSERGQYEEYIMRLCLITFLLATCMLSSPAFGQTAEADAEPVDEIIVRGTKQTDPAMSAFLAGDYETAEIELAEARGAPERVAADREKLSGSLEEAEQRRKYAADSLAVAETAERDAKEAERNAERKASEAREQRAAAEAR